LKKKLSTFNQIIAFWSEQFTKLCPFLRKTANFLGELAKMAENSDHNIGVEFDP
jgi:hypothetical protein